MAMGMGMGMGMGMAVSEVGEVADREFGKDQPRKDQPGRDKSYER